MAYNEDSQATPACTLETIDGAMYDFIEKLNLHSSTNKGLSKAKELDEKYKVVEYLKGVKKPVVA